MPDMCYLTCWASSKPPSYIYSCGWAFDRVRHDQIFLLEPVHSVVCGLVDQMSRSFNQSVLTIVRLLLEQVISLHGVPSELLSNRGKEFHQIAVWSVWPHRLKKVNTMAYQLYDLLERLLLPLIPQWGKEEKTTWKLVVLYNYDPGCTVPSKPCNQGNHSALV